MKIRILTLVFLFAIMLCAQTVFPAYALRSIEKNETNDPKNSSLKASTPKSGNKQHFPVFNVSALFPKAIVEKTTMAVDVKELDRNATVTVTRYDITAVNGTRYVKFEACYNPSRIADELGYAYKMETPPISAVELERMNLLTSQETSSIIYNPVRKVWDGVTFISTESTPLYVRYDHPDNGPYPSATYDYILPDENVGYHLHGESKLHIHLPVHVVDDIELYGSLAVSSLVAIILALLPIPEPSSKIAAIILAIATVLILALIPAWNVWVNTVLRTELDDGWQWMWDVGRSGDLIWGWTSFGAWRDIGLPFTFLIPPDLVWATAWTNPHERLYWDSVIAKYEEETGIYIDMQPFASGALYDQIKWQHITGNDPDIISVPATWLPEFAHYRSPIVAAAPNYVIRDVAANYLPATFYGSTYKGILYAYPSEYRSWALVYNKRMLDAKGYAPPQTWDELKTVAKALTVREGGRITVSGFMPYVVQDGDPSGETYEFMNLLWSNNGEFLDLSGALGEWGVPKALFNSAQGVQTLQLFDDLNENRHPGQGSYDPDYLPLMDWQGWASEEIAMVVIPSWMGSSIRSAMGPRFFTNLGVAPIPIGPSMVGAGGIYPDDSECVTYNWLTAVSQKAEDEGRAIPAWSFLKWLNTPRDAGYISGTPVGNIPWGGPCSIMGDFLIYDSSIPSRISDQTNGRTRDGNLLMDDFWFKGFMDQASHYGRADKAFTTTVRVQDKVGIMFERGASYGEDPQTITDETVAEVNPILPVPGDANMDGRVDVGDGMLVVKDFDARPYTLNWNRGRADIIEDNLVSGKDGGMIVYNYGREGGSLYGGSYGFLSQAYAGDTVFSLDSLEGGLYPLTEAYGGLTVFSLDPSLIVSSEYGPSTCFTVNVNVADATDLFGFGFKLKYNATLLSATSITLGSVFPGPVGSQPNGPTIMWKNEINNDLGYVWYAVSLGRYASSYPYGISVYGSGTLATITFIVNAWGGTILDLSDTTLVDSGGNAIAHEVYGSLFTNLKDPPVVSFTASKTTVKVAEEIAFDASASYDPDYPEEGGYIISYYWDFGDGTTEYSLDRWGRPDPYADHSYELAGTYAITLVVTDDMGVQGKAELTITVR